MYIVLYCCDTTIRGEIQITIYISLGRQAVWAK